MAATAEWVDIPFTLQSPYATITLNAATGDRYLLVPAACDMGAPLRVTKQPLPQFDGSNTSPRRWFEGYEARLSMLLWVDDEPACGADLVRMTDTLNGIAWSLRDAGDNEGRLLWTPSGENIRMLDDIKLLERLVLQVAAEGTGTTASLAVDSPYPYAQDFTQVSTALDATINNTGTAEYWPVFQISGTETFVLQNVTTGLEIQYALIPGLPPIGGGYVEIDCFRSTAYINGNQADALGNIVIPESDFFSLVPGSNQITLTSGSGTMLWAPAWA